MDREIDKVSGIIVDAAMKLHMRVGPGLLESVYETLLAQELRRRGLKVDRQQSVAFELEGFRFDDGFRVDLLVESQIVVELKSVEKLAPVHSKQLLTYLKVADKRLGLLINFGEVLIKNGITRVANNLRE